MNAHRSNTIFLIVLQYISIPFTLLALLIVPSETIATTLLGKQYAFSTPSNSICEQNKYTLEQRINEDVALRAGPLFPLNQSSDASLSTSLINYGWKPIPQALLTVGASCFTYIAASASDQSHLYTQVCSQLTLPISKRSALSVRFSYTPYTSNKESKKWGKFLGFYTATKQHRKQNSSLVETTKLSAGLGYQHMKWLPSKDARNTLTTFLLVAKLSKSYMLKSERKIGFQAIYLHPVAHKHTSNSIDLSCNLPVYPGIEFSGIFSQPLHKGSITIKPFLKCVVCEQKNRCLGVKAAYLMQY